MKTILVEDEVILLNHLNDICQKIPGVEVVGVFESSEEALLYSMRNPVELALLDVEMPVMNGIDLARRMRYSSPDLVVMFVSAYDQYMAEAYHIQADYYVLKPYSESDIEAAISRAKLLQKRMKKRVAIRTFGHFDIFVDGVPLAFPGHKAKEMLALLVDRRGGILSTVDAYSIVWENKPYTNNAAGLCRRAMKNMLETLEAAGIGDLVFNYTRGHALNVSEVDCDYYNFLDGDEDAIRKFNGHYMSQYSWGEVTLGNLISQQQMKLDKP